MTQSSICADLIFVAVILAFVLGWIIRGRA